MLYAYIYSHEFCAHGLFMPTVGAPMSPSISVLGMRAATESMTTMSMPPLPASWAAMSRASSPLLGWQNLSRSSLTPIFCTHPAVAAAGIVGAGWQVAYAAHRWTIGVQRLLLKSMDEWQGTKIPC